MEQKVAHWIKLKNFARLRKCQAGEEKTPLVNKRGAQVTDRLDLQRDKITEMGIIVRDNL